MIYIYQHREPFINVSTLKEAALETHVSTTTVKKYLQTGMATKKGFFFSDKPIPEEDLKRLPDNNIQVSKNGLVYTMEGKCRKVIDGQEYEVNSNDGMVTYVPPTKQGKKEALSSIIAKVARDRWRNIPRHIATLERQYIRELIDSL